MVGGLALVLHALAPGSAAQAGEPVAVAAAASLRAPVETLAMRFAASPGGAPVEPSFGPSPLLARQVAAGAPIDVLLAADEATIDDLVGRGLVLAETRTVFAGNRLAVLVRPERAEAVRSPRDLAGPDVERIALPDAAVPLGHYAREWLARTGLADAVLARALRTEDARATLAAVDTGSADAAIVYTSDAAVAKSARPAFAIPDAEQPRIAYAGAVVVRARDVARARALLAFVAASADVFEAAGFRPPPGAPAP
jgi:molybdate transport system substrate-binding protein